MRCSHDTNICITEYAVGHITHSRADGRVIHSSGFGSFTGEVEFECRTCGYKRFFGKRAKKPAWVEALLDQMLSHPQPHAEPPRASD